MYEAVEDMGNLQASIVESLNGLRFEVYKLKNAELRPLAIQKGKENLHKYNIMRLNQTGLCLQTSNHYDRKHSFC
jgi:hypothetical protein